jgi:hypothetical protein
VSHRCEWRLAPADVVLELLRDQRIPYRCHAQLGRWDTTCPLCAAPMVIREHGTRGRVSLRCEHGCDPDKALARLKHPERCPACGTNPGQVAELARAAGELLDLAHAQQQLLRELVTDDVDLQVAA